MAFTFAFIGFAASLLILGGLFTLKYIETQKGVLYIPHLRTQTDRYALTVKAVCLATLARIEKLPQEVLALIRFFVHMAALLFARLARAAEVGAHQLADRVSHKHQFKRGESRSEFLKSVREHKQNLEKER